MGTRKVFGLAVVATLAPFPIIASPLPPPPSVNSNPKEIIVKCEKDETLKQTTVRVPNTTVTVECQENYEINPAVDSSQETQKVCDKEDCQSPQLLSQYCPGAHLTTPEKEPATPGAALVIGALPSAQAVFFLQCKPKNNRSENKICAIEVTVNQAPEEDQPGAGGAAPVQICRQPKASIVVSVPDKGSAVAFSCEKEYNLYPSDARKVFKDDCKTEENLQDMTRTQEPAPASPPNTRNREQAAASSIVYTLQANKKPSKKKLCYLCAKKDVTPSNKGSATDYCTIYVESSALTQFGPRLPLAVMLHCALAMLPS